MKKYLIISLSCALHSMYVSAQSQSILLTDNNRLDFYKLEFNEKLEKKETVEKREELKLSQTTLVYKNKKNKTESIGTAVYNQKGYLTEMKNKKSTKKLTYQNDTLLVNYDILDKKVPTKFNYSYQKGHFSGYQKIKNGKIVSELIIIYNDKGRVTSRLTKKGKNLKKTTEHKTFYNSDGKIEKSQSFVNNKLKREYIYDCKPEGEIIKNEKIDQNAVCSWKEERNDGSYVNYTRTIEEKKTYLWKGTFDKDSNLISTERFLNDTIKIYSYEKTDHMETTKNFRKNGKQSYSNILIYNDAKLLKEQQWISNGIKTHVYTYTNEYDTKGSLTRTTNRRNGILTSTTEYNHIYR